MLLFDSCVIINILKLHAQTILDELVECECSFAYIHPVLVELNRADNSEDRIIRSGLLDQYQFVELPLHKVGLLSKAKEIQEELHVHNCHPEPEDIYLGATVATTGLGELYLLTTNQKDFPLPVFVREGNILIQNTKRVMPISLIKYQGLV